MTASQDGQLPPVRGRAALWLSDAAFYAAAATIGGSYVLLILLLLGADAAYMFRETMDTARASADPWLTALTQNPIVVALGKEEIQYSILLSMASCTLSAILSLWVAVPIGYLLSRVKLPGRSLVDAVLDIPIVLPPLVVGLSLLILFQFWPLITPFSELLPFRTPWDRESLNTLVVYQVPAVVLAQFAVACAFAVRTMKATFDHIDPRCEEVAITLGCSRAQAFWYVVLPEARAGMLTAVTLAWARALGEFGPLLIFAGATRKKTEVLSATVFLEMSIGDIEAAVAVSLIMVAAAVVGLMVARLWGSRDFSL